MNSRDIPVSGRPEKEPVACPQCGSASRIGRDLCLSCLLAQGVGADGHPPQVDDLSASVPAGASARAETLDEVLCEINMRDADWRLGNYQILEEIGRGGTGVIYRARQRYSRRIVALKRILPCHADSQETLARFRREAQAAASLDHPHILPIYEVGECQEGLPFFSMKFAGGGSLLEAAQSLRSEPRCAVALMTKVARAVQYAHGQGILHRDLKPGNILLDGGGEPLVSDFGLAKWLDTASDLTHTLTAFGTPGYIAPEQANRSMGKLTPAADVYSLGAILFDLLTGRPPFFGEHALAVIQQAAEGPAPKLRSLAPELGRDLETICAKCLEREPGARYRSAGDLAEDLERWLEGRSIIAHPVSPPARVWRWSRRNPIVAGMAALLLALGTAVGVMIWKGEFASRPPTTGIAVLPFESVSEDKENAFFADVVYDGVSTKLAKVADLKVISHNSVMRYRGVHNTQKIGRELNVSHLLEGAVRWEAGRVHLNVKLVDTRTERQIWTERYDSDLNQVFRMQGEIAQKVADQLQAKVSSAEKAAIREPPTTNLVAYDRYLRAKDLIATAVYFTPLQEGLFEAVKMLNQAIERDPAFALAYYQLAHAHDLIYFVGLDHTPARLAMADTAIQSLTRRLPDSGEAHLALAKHLYWGYHNYDRAREELSLAQKSLPNEPWAFVLAGYIDRRQGRWAESSNNLERAVGLDPQNPHALQQIAGSYNLLRRYADQERALDRAIAVTPKEAVLRASRAEVELDWHADTRPLLSTIEAILAEDSREAKNVAGFWLRGSLCKRDFDDARRALAALPAAGCYEDAIPFPPAWCEGVVAQMRGDQAAAHASFTSTRAEATKLVAEQPDYPEGLCVLGMADAVLGNKEDAIREGRRAVELLPVTKDSIVGALLVENLALIYAWTGEKELAFEQLAIAAKVPGFLSYGELRLHPYWDPLRGDPRFEEIVSSLAPRQSIAPLTTP